MKKSTDSKNFFKEMGGIHCCFSEAEINEQSDEVAVYILSVLSDDNLESINSSIDDIKDLLGYELSIEAALIIRRLVKNMAEKEKQRCILSKINNHYYDV